jgi:hypothetical protein
MGLSESAPVRICRQGEPCIVLVRSTRVGLSRAVARQLHAVGVHSARRETLRDGAAPAR